MIKFKKVIMLVTIASLLLLSACGGANGGDNEGTSGESSFPTKPINMIVGYAAGGSTDMTARPAADAATEILGQPVVVINRPGAGGSVGLSEVIRSNPDGYTIAMSSIGPTTIVPYTADVGYTYEDLVPIAQLTDQPLALAVSKDSPIENLADFVEYAKANPGKVRYGTPGAANIQHVTGLRFKEMADIELIQVPFDGAAPAVAALLGGNVEAAITSVQEFGSHYKNGAIKVLGVTSEERETTVMPDVPTFKEQGYDLKAGVWYGVLGPKGMPDEVVNQLAATFEEVGNDPGVLDAWEKLNLIPCYAGPEEFAARIAEEAEAHSKLVKEIGLSN